MKQLKHSDFSWHENQPDVPGKSAEEMKRFLDAPTKTLMEKINEIIGGEEAGNLTELAGEIGKKADDEKMQQLAQELKRLPLPQLSETNYQVADLPVGISVAPASFCVTYKDTDLAEKQRWFHTGTLALHTTYGELHSVYFLPPHINSVGDGENAPIDDAYRNARLVQLRSYNRNGGYECFEDAIILPETITRIENAIADNALSIRLVSQNVEDYKAMVDEKQDHLTTPEQAEALVSSGMALGFKTTVTGANSLAGGYSSLTAKEVLGTVEGSPAQRVMGVWETQPTGSKYTIAFGEYSRAFGRDCAAIGNGSQAIGIETATEGEASIAAGKYAKTESAAEGAMALGLGVKATAAGQAVVGKYNAPDSRYVFAVGAGTSDTDRKRVFWVKNDGSTSLDEKIKPLTPGEGIQIVDGVISLNVENAEGGSY